MPTPTIPAGNLFMNATLYTGNSTTNTITNGVAGQSFQPDFVWIKSRSNAQNNDLFDVNRGAGYALFSNLSNIEANNTANFTSFNSNGFSLASNGGDTNFSGYTYVGWQWKAGGAAVTNTAGTISSQVSSNPTSGFSIVTYTGNATGGATVGHGCQVNSIATAPSMIILKSRTVGTNWYVYHSNLTSALYQIYLNLTSGEDNSVTTAFNSVAPGTTTFTLPGTGFGSNNSGATYVAYCFAPVAGYSAFGSYTGNNAADGPFVFLGFRPRFIMIKRTNSGTTGNWNITDTAINPYNNTTGALRPNTDDSESTVGTVYVQPLSNGFKITNNNTDTNGSSTYIYMAFAENPFKYANAR